MDELVAELKNVIIEELKLEEVTPEQIDPTGPLFNQGLGLSSIDALEMVVILEERYGFKIENLEQGQEAFRSVQALAEYVQRNRIR